MVRDEVLPTVNDLPGCRGLSLLVDRNEAELIATTSWDSLEAMRATEQSVAPLRARAADLFGGTPEVQEWEIAVMHRAHHAPPGACARSTFLSLPDVDRAYDVFSMFVLPRAQDLKGFCSGLLLVNRENGRAVSTIAFDNQETLAATREAANDIRAQASSQSGASILDVREHELVLAHLHVPEMA